MKNKTQFAKEGDNVIVFKIKRLTEGYYRKPIEMDFIFRIYRFEDGDFGFYLNNGNWGNFVLNRKKAKKLIDFLKGEKLT